MGWDVSESMVKELVESGVGGVTTRLQALAVFQHCSLRDLTLFEFLAQYRVEGMGLIPLCSMPAAAAFAEGDFPQPSESDMYEPDWRFTDWRSQTVSANRLECLRKHIAEVADSWGSECVLWHDLRRMEVSLARVVEPIPTLGMVADDDGVAGVAVRLPDQHEPCDDLDQSDDDIDSNTPAPVIAPPSSAEQADIAAVLANPKAAAAGSVASRKDSQDRVLASEATLAELYACADRIGINKIAVQELACKQFKLRAIEDLPESSAQKVIVKMKAQAAAA